MEIRDASRFTRKPSCVMLDLDDTLYLYAPAHQAGMAAAEAVASQQLNIASADFRATFRDARTEVKNRLGRTAASHHRLLYFSRAIERAGFSTQPLTAMQMDQAYWRAFLNVAQLFEQVPDFLDDLRIAGVPVVIVTDLIAQVQYRKIVHFGLDRLVDWVVTSEEAGVDKPAPAMFELALAKLGGVEGPVWMIGEQPRSDIAGARAAVDALGIQKRHAGVEVLAEGADAPDAVFDDFGQLRRFLAQLVAQG
jgi:putative hydrolase of the HAD superfamily